MAVKRLNQISLSLLVPVKGEPKSVKLPEHSLEFQGMEPSKGGLITAIHGSQSKHAMFVAAANWTKERLGKLKSDAPDRMLVLDFGYEIENLMVTRHNSSEDVLAETGLINFDRMAASYREEVKAQWLEWISVDHSPSTASNLTEKSFKDLCLLFPKYVSRMFDEDKRINVIIHPVHPMIEPRLEIWVATVRYTKRRIAHPEMRFSPEIQVTL